MSNQIIEKPIDSEKLEKGAAILKTIAHPLRISIANALTLNERLSVNEICKLLGSEQSLTSHHLNNMKLNGVLGNERQGQHIYYFLKFKEITKIIDCIKDCDMMNN